MLELLSMLWELAFLSVTVLRPHLAKELMAEPNTESIASGWRWSFCIRSWTKYEYLCGNRIHTWSTYLSYTKRRSSLPLSAQRPACPGTC